MLKKRIRNVSQKGRGVRREHTFAQLPGNPLIRGLRVDGVERLSRNLRLLLLVVLEEGKDRGPESVRDPGDGLYRTIGVVSFGGVRSFKSGSGDDIGGFLFPEGAITGVDVAFSVPGRKGDRPTSINFRRTILYKLWRRRGRRQREVCPRGLSLRERKGDSEREKHRE